MRLSLILAVSLCMKNVDGECQRVELDFIINAGDASHRAIEDDIRADLEKVGVVVTPRYESKEDFNAAMVAGDFDLAFSETWGAPYDPHSYVNSWTTPDEAHYSVLKSLESPLDPVSFEAWVDDALRETDAAKRQTIWTSMLSAIHDAVFHIPLWGKRIPSVVRKSRIANYAPGQQQFDYPIQKARVVDGPKNVTVAPGAQTGLFQSVGPLHPHSYRPNEFFSNNWVYEGLVAYGPDGAIEPALATAWTSEVGADGRETFTFKLRQGVIFHDGADFTCDVVKLNFDHVFAPPLRGPDWHGWYDLPISLAEWYCADEFTFVLISSEPYYPLLQELTYIRPLRMLSPNAFVNGINTSPITDNSCPASWGTVTGDDVTIECVGTLAPSGTGPFKYITRSTNADGMDDLVVFQQNLDYWNGPPDIEYIHLIRYESATEVKDALLAGSLDMVLGGGVLEPTDVIDFQYNEDFDTLFSESTQNTVIIMNIEDISIRQTVVHAINKVPIIERELGGIEKPVSQLFPESAPYCDLDLTPKWDYDIDKATLINCPEPQTSKKSKKSTVNSLFIGLFVVAAVLLVALIAFLCLMVRRERAGEPIFTPLTNPLIDEDELHQMQGNEVELPDATKKVAKFSELKKN